MNITITINDVYSPLEVKTGPSGSPHATRTRLGWAVWNLVRGEGGKPVINRADVTAILQLDIDKQMDLQMKALFNADFPEKTINDRREYSTKDKKFLATTENSLRLTEGHYEMRLPFRNPDVQFPDNRFQVLARQNSLKKKLTSNSEFHKEYTDFMEGIIAKHYAERVPDNEVLNERAWYIPHHAVHKFEKIRVVFNCAASFYGVSLNQMLLQGPDLTQNLLGILLKFCCKPVAVMADIEKMFYQVRVRNEDCDFLRFFWWPSGNLHAELVPYRMLVHLFGAVSSPACANLALHKTAEDNQSLFPSDTCETVGTRFYVDDLLTCLQTEEEAISLVNDITDLCSRGGFHLTQWSSNSRRVLQQIPDEERSKMLWSLDLANSELPEHRALGVRWCPELDQFGFDV